MGLITVDVQVLHLLAPKQASAVTHVIDAIRAVTDLAEAPTIHVWAEDYHRLRRIAASAIIPTRFHAEPEIRLVIGAVEIHPLNTIEGNPPSC